MGFEVVTVEWAGAPRHRVVRVYLDRPEGSESGITLDDITRLSPIVGNALDAAESAPGGEELNALLRAGYTLEVSSPGVERPLATRAHFERYVGHRISVRTYEPLEPGDKQRGFHGFVQSCEADPDAPGDQRAGTLILKDADADRLYRIPLPAMKRAHLVFED